MGWGARSPLICRVFPPGKPGNMPYERSLLHIDAENILLVSMKPEPTGNGLVLHLRDIEGKSAEFQILLPGDPENIPAIREVNVLGEPIGPPTHKILMGGLESKFFLIEF